MTLRVLIVDDEPLARRRLRTLLHDEPGVEVAGECATGAAAVKAIRAERPDVVFLDIQMPGMDGFDVIAALGPDDCPAVVFVTAYDQYAVKAFEVHALDYLLKPFERRRLRQALDRARLLAGRGHDVAKRLLAMVARAGPSRHLDRFVVRSRGRVYFVRAHDVDWIEADGHYATLHAGRDAHLVRETIRSLAERLDPAQFVRVHRSAIVNLDRVRELVPAFHGEYEIVLRDGTRLSSSRGYSARLQQLLRR